MVKKLVERMQVSIRSTYGFVTVELAIGIATLSFAFMAAIAALGVFLTQLNLIDTAHSAARLAARGQEFQAPAEIKLTEQISNGNLIVTAQREIFILQRPINLSARAKVVIE